MIKDERLKAQTLGSLSCGESAIIKGVKGNGAFYQRLIEMGFVSGTKIKVIKKAPLQDPLEYELMNYRVSLRRKEADLIEVVKEEVKEGKEINIALVGNPNCGKTTLFNYTTNKHEKVGNYSGVTVSLKTAHINKDGYRINITDLPGTYSISEYTPEELIVREHIEKEKPDVVINVVDSTNIERNLLLTSQLINMNANVVIALNMYDELTNRGDSLDYETLSKRLNVPIVPTIAYKGKGIDDLIDKVIETYEKGGKEESNKEKKGKTIEEEYEYIRDVIQGIHSENKDKRKRNRKYDIDKILTHRWFGFPLFIFFMWLTFQLTFSLSEIPMQWIESGVGLLSEFVQQNMRESALRDLLVDGVIAGVGSVIVFLPNILILFSCISLMEDTGYMARAAFIMDRLMNSFGLHGKSFIPLLMGFGCNVPAIMATRTLESKKDRILTMLIIPFMSCSARLPVYVLLISAFFPKNKGLVLLSIYLIGILLAVLMAIIFRKIFFSKEKSPFVMEIPPYRIPTLRNTIIHIWNKSVHYLTKMGTVILLSSIIIWALSYFPLSSHQVVTDSQIATTQVDNFQQVENSYIGKLGHFIEPIIKPLGFDWRIGVSIISGFAAKEIVVGSMAVLYQGNISDYLTPTNAYSLMIFILLYFPCVAAISAIAKESNWKWAFLAVFYTTSLAWILAFLSNQIGNLL